MFANRFTALVDACVLAGALKRNLLLSLAEAEFFRLRWSTPSLTKREQAILRILADRGADDAADRARRSRQAMERASESMLSLVTACPPQTMAMCWRRP
jgi:hypothetical protein